MKASSPASSLSFSNKTGDYFDLALSTPSLSAHKKVYIYTYDQSSEFVVFFEKLASFRAPWLHREVLETLEGELKLEATCDALGHVEIKVSLFNTVENDDWFLSCVMVFEFGSLERFSLDAKRFMDFRNRE